MRDAKFQSTHPRGVRPRWDLLPLRTVEVSIHAPTWGATRELAQLENELKVSIHAPTWGATFRHSRFDVQAQFQSTHPRGVRRGVRAVVVRRVRVSIHAPTWGATHLKAGRIVQFGVSIHAPTWGATCTKMADKNKLRFQSTHPRGVRPKSRSATGTGTSFNPRTHVGCDSLYFYDFDFCRVSIHAPTWGATLFSYF